MGPTDPLWWECYVSKRTTGVRNPGLQTILVVTAWSIAYPLLIALMVLGVLSTALTTVAVLLNSEGFVSTAVLLVRAGHRLGDDVVNSLEGAVDEVTSSQDSQMSESLVAVLDRYDPAIRLSLNNLSLLSIAFWNPHEDKLLQRGVRELSLVVGKLHPEAGR